MPDPREVFENPGGFLPFLTSARDDDIENQLFDRKEACRPDPSGAVPKSQLTKLRDHITECISAFANTNVEGGLVVIGVTKTGDIAGINHLDDQQRTGITNFNISIRNHAARVKLHTCRLPDGSEKDIALLYVPHTPNALCETAENRPKAYQRNGPQNVLLDDRQRDQLRREKRVVDDESSFATVYSEAELDEGLLKEILATWRNLASATQASEVLLHSFGAIERDRGEFHLTKAGMLFFAANPQRVYPSAYIRLLRFDSRLGDEPRGPLTFERKFTGPITKQIRDFRAFTTETGFFKVYQYRRLGGGFVQEPEYPPIAVDEAVVNAVAHRDYACPIPIECEAYHDAFIVRNAGRILQRNSRVPSHFSLEDTTLIHTPRNPKLIEWLKEMRDNQGASFVRALSEGTTRMRDEMANLDLPPPTYDVSETETTVTLLSPTDRRAIVAARALQTEAALDTTEYANLFPLEFIKPGRGEVSAALERDARLEFLNYFRDRLVAQDWFIDRFSHGLITAHRKGDNIHIPQNISSCVRLYPACSFAVRDYYDRSYLLIDLSLEVKNVLNGKRLAEILGPEHLINRTGIAKTTDWQRGKIVDADSEWTTFHLFDYEQQQRVPSSLVIPNLPLWLIRDVLRRQGISFDLDHAIKQHSLAASPAASRIRAEWTLNVATDLARSIFPLAFRGTSIRLSSKPLALARTDSSLPSLPAREVPEPSVEFGHHRESPNIREGITQFGSYESSHKDIELVPLVLRSHRQKMADLIDRLKVGKYKYKGSERTFSTRLRYSGITTVESPDDLHAECERLLREHPNWVGGSSLSRIFLVHVPEAGYAADDHHSPYFSVKRLLLENGIPCQMVDTPTLANPDFKDLNLSLNIVAKCGLVPWVLHEGVPDADFFIGLSYTQRRGAADQRLIGYANVFNEYGRWLFYSGNTQAFDYNERTTHFGSLVKETLSRLNLSESPNVYFHYSARFSRDDRNAIIEAARSVRPQGTYTFIWINSHSPVRLYDSSPETDGSLRRGSYVIGGDSQLYVSTTGYNPFRKSLGTPQMLEVNAWKYFPEGTPTAPPDARSIAAQILSLTKLNWSSTDSLCAEPITIKYAGDIAYLTAAFQRQGTPFQLHSALEQTPWFI